MPKATQLACGIARIRAGAAWLRDPVLNPRTHCRPPPPTQEIVYIKPRTALKVPGEVPGAPWAGYKLLLLPSMGAERFRGKSPWGTSRHLRLGWVMTRWEAAPSELSWCRLQPGAERGIRLRRRLPHSSGAQPMWVDDSGSAVPGVVALGVVGGLKGVASVRKAAPPVPRAGPGAPCGCLPGSHGIFGGWGLKATAGGAQRSKGQEPGSACWSWQHPRPGQEHASAGRCCHLRPKVWQQVRLDTAALSITKGPPVPRVSAPPAPQSQPHSWGAPSCPRGSSPSPQLKS